MQEALLPALEGLSPEHFKRVMSLVHVMLHLPFFQPAIDLSLMQEALLPAVEGP